MPTTEEFLDAAWQNAPRFGLNPSSISLLSHSENVVCEVQLEDESRVVMRLHRPGYNTIDELESEVAWVAALGRAGVPVPSAVPTVDGGHYTHATVGDERRHVGVVRWVDGAPLGGPTSPGGAEVVAQYELIGEIAAQIRQHHAVWEPPTSFVRRRWDTAGFVGSTPLWGRFWQLDALTTAQRELFTAGQQKLHDELSGLSVNNDRFGLIHADLHLGNLMAHNDRLTVIDFDDAGFGWFAHELAVALHPMLGEPEYDGARESLLAGYRRIHPLSADEESLIDTFLVMRSLMIVAWLDARRELPVYEHFADLVTLAQEMTDAYLRR